MKLSALNQAEILSMSPSELMASLKETPDEEVVSLPPGVQKYVELALRPESRERALYEQPASSEQRLRSLLSGATLGLSEPVVAAGKAAARKVMGQGDLGDLYSQEIAAQEQYQKNQPGEAMLAEIAGGLSPVGLGAKAVGLGAKAGKALTKGLSEGALKKALQPILSGALGGAATGAVSGGAELLEGKEPSEAAQDVATGTGAGAILSAIPVVGKAAMKSPEAIGKAFTQVLTGVPYEQSGKYYQRAQIIDVLEPNRQTFVDETISAIEGLKDSVVNQSKIARQVLETSNKDLDLSKTKNLIGTLRDKLVLSIGQTAGPGAQANVDKLTSLENTISLYKKGVPAKDAKKIIDELDDTVEHIKRSGDFTTSVSNNLSQVRHEIDSELKEKIPAYAAKMKPLAEDTQLLNEVTSKKLNDPKTLTNLTPKIGSPRGEIETQLLKRLGSATKKDLIQTAEDYQTAEAFTKTYPQGSFRPVVTGAIGKLLGQEKGGLIGIITGGVADKFGPRMAENVIGALSAIGHNPTVSKITSAIENADLPQIVKDTIKSTLIEQRIERE